jgi:type I restriction enzyme S subunit
MSGLPKGWKEAKLENVGFVITGKTPASNDKDHWGEKVDFITPTDFIDSSKYIKSRDRKLSEDGENAFKRLLIPQNSVIVTCIGSDMGKVAVNKNQCVTNQQINSIIVDQSKYSVDYIYYLLTASKKLLRLYADGGSTMPIINKSTFSNLKFKYPSLPEQKAIADILSSLDDKIELLREQNETLENLAQTLFKEWFVNFNYPNATGEMEESELGEIPKGWRVFKLSELIDTINGYSYKGSELVEQSSCALVTLKSFNRDGGFQTRGFKPFVGTPKTTQEVFIGDLVVAHTDLTQDAEVLGNPAFIFENAGFEKMFITMDLVKVICLESKIGKSFLYYAMKDPRFKGHCKGYSNGTTVLHLSKKAIPEYEIALPKDLQLVKEFSEMADTITDKISTNIRHYQSLEQTRDALLPKLLNGSVRVQGFGE